MAVGALSGVWFGMLPFQRLNVWRLSHEFALAIRTESGRWPSEERYGLTAQVRRAALSIPTNIAEGQAKRGTRELRRYLDICLGSFSEVTYLLIFARDCHLIPEDRWTALESQRKEVGLVLWRFYRGVARHSDR
jgi:four helix bundle protein